MEPTTFKQSNKVLNAPHDRPDVLPLHVFDDKQQNYVISCWQLSWRERFSALFFGKTWVWVMSASGTQPPIALQVKRSIFRKQK